MPEKMPPDAVGSLPDQVETAVLGGVSANGGELVVASQRRSREKQHSEPQSHLGFCRELWKENVPGAFSSTLSPCGDMSPLSYEALLSDENARGATERGANRCQGFYGGSADDGDEQATARSKLVWALLICCTAVLVEVVGGLLAHSLALLTDAAHLLSDLSGYLIGLFALWAVSLQASQKSSFGYHREFHGSTPHWAELKQYNILPVAGRYGIQES